MKKIYGSLPLFMAKKVTFGPITLRVKKSLIKKNSVLWRDEKGKILSEGTVRYLIGYLYSTPSETMYNRKNPTDLKFIEDEAFASIYNDAKEVTAILVSSVKKIKEQL